MAERNPPVWLQSGTYSAEDDRLVTGLLADRNTNTAGDFEGIAGGVIPPLDQMKVTPEGGNSMHYNVSRGVALIPTTDSDPQGAYLVANEGNYSSLAAGTGVVAETSANDRKDVIVARVYDSAIVGGTSSWKIEVIKGSPNANPETPAIPATWVAIPLAEVTVKPASRNGGVNKITATQIRDLRHFVAAPGGVHLWWSGGDVPAPQHSPGRLIYDVTRRSLYLSAWDPKAGPLNADGQPKGKMVLDPLYTYNEWMAYRAMYRPRQVTLGSYVYTANNEWIKRPKKQTNDKSLAQPIQISNVRAPNKLLKVSLTAYGRVTETGSSGHMGVEVSRASNNAVEAAANVTKAISFYHKSWIHHGATFLIGGLPDNVNLNVNLEFTQRSGTGRAIFGKCILMVEPVV